MAKVSASRLVVALTMICLGLVGLLGATWLHKISETAARFFDHLSAAFLVVGLIAVVEKYFTEKELTDRLIKLLGVRHAVHDAGVESAYVGPDKTDFSKLFLHSRCLSVVFNDGFRWCSQADNSRLFAERFKQKHTRTEVLLLDPESDFLSVLANKTREHDQSVDGERQRIREKIRKTIDLIRTLHSENTTGSELAIYLISVYPTYTLFLGDECAVFSLYTTSSSTRQPVPVFEVYDKGDESLFQFVCSDLVRLREASRLCP